MKSNATSCYVVNVTRKGKSAFQVVKLRIIGGLERILNGGAKTVLEYEGNGGKKKLKGQFTEVGGPFTSQTKAPGL
jgi:hypothetical protein